MAGTAAGPGNTVGIRIAGGAGPPRTTTASGARVAADRNVISGNNVDGIQITAAGPAWAANNLVQGNYIGTDVTGTLDLGNANQGVAVFTGGARTRTP